MSWKKFNGHYVYTYFDNKDKPYYVGMGKGRRVTMPHLYVDIPDDKDNKIEVIDGLTEQEAWDKEIELIEKYGRKCINTGILENLAPGGKGQSSGWHHSEIGKQRISKGNKGKVRTEEHKKNYRGTKTKKHAENISKGMKGIPHTEERKKNISKAMKIATTEYWRKVKSGEIVRKQKNRRI